MTRSLIYDVAVSVDGFIAGDGEDVSGFLFEGDHVEAYRERLATYDTVLMGRRTYEFGYRFGLPPGYLPYPTMRHLVFSRTLDLPAGSPVEVIRDDALRIVDELKAGDGSDIYVCGGGTFAGWLMAQGRLDTVLLKVNPMLLGKGVPLLENMERRLKLVDITPYGSGVVLARYEVDYAR